MSRGRALSSSARLPPPNAVEGRKIAEKVIGSFPTCPVPEIARLVRALNRWRQAFLAYFDTGRSNNGGTEVCEPSGYRD